MGIKTAALAALLGVCVAGSAQAQVRSRALSPTYGFVYGEFSHLSDNGVNIDGGGGGLGWHFTRYLGIQGGGGYFRENAVDFTTANAELMLTYPASDKLSLYGGLGGSYVHATTDILATSFTRQSTGYRAGIGVEYWFSRPWGLRFGYHRQNAGGVLDDMSVGIALRF